MKNRYTHGIARLGLLLFVLIATNVRMFGADDGVILTLKSGEELGFVGAVLIILLFMLLILRGYWIAIHARDRFGALLAGGITTLLALQVFFNIGVVTNLIPNTGISLPFFSYGGTALVIHLAEMGVVLSVSRQIPAPKKD